MPGLSGMTRRLVRAPLLVSGLVLCLTLLAPLEAAAYLPVKAAFMMNLSTGRVLYQKNPDMRIPPASLTKIMTSFLVHDAVAAGRLSMQSRLRVPREAANAGGSSMRLRQGESVTVEQLLHGAIISSGNDAATALAVRTAGSQRRFVQQMNAKARSLGLKQTRFKNPTGLPASGQVTTARDMARLARAYINAHPRAMRIHSKSSFRHGRRTLTTTNPFLGSRGVNGLKTGFTLGSGYNIILTTGRGKNRLLIVVLGGKSRTRRERAAASLLDAGLSHPGSPALVAQAIDGSGSRQLASTKTSAEKPKPQARKQSQPPARGKVKKQSSGNKQPVTKKQPAQKQQPAKRTTTEQQAAKQAQKNQTQTQTQKKQADR